ncbi:hypothetical protein [Streptodolium elevatio]|uniref:Hydrolase n=1 Tax=Streptodolium elevatio TaxID=3157996 RepID=A0ABV3DJA5_9ACTN
MDAAHSPAAADPAVGAPYCGASAARPLPPAADAGTTAGLADCAYCGKPTEYPAAQRGVTLCPVCEWQEDQRGACSG